MAITPEEIANLEKMARRIRWDIIKMIGEAGSGHPGGSLSVADIITALYFKLLRHDPQRPDWPERDRLVLAKGHAAPALYAAMAESGYFPREELWTLRKLGSRLQGHPARQYLPGVEVSTGSLGQGLSMANGMAIAGKLDGRDYRVYVILGDGELEEGQVWEAAMTAVHRSLDNLTAFVDFNGLQIDGPIREVKSVVNISERFRAFGWYVQEIDGHNFAQIIGAVEKAKAMYGRPTVIVARTVKGKGVSFMENQVDWHGTAPKPEQVAAALEELGGEEA